MAKRKDLSLHFLAVEAAGWTVGLPVSSLARLTRDLSKKFASSDEDSDLKSTIDIGRWLGDGVTPSAGGLFAELKEPYEGYALQIDRGLEVFQIKQSEIRTSQRSGKEETAAPILGFSPWAKLTASLVRGALSANNLAFSRLATLGPIAVRGDQLWAGSRRLNGDTSIVDTVQRATSYGCTIFQKNVRISTTAKRAGSQVRALGSKAGADVSETVLHRGREFRGLTRTIGKEWAIVYRPLLDENHKIVGMVATYREVSARLFPLMDLAALIEKLREEAA